MGVTVHGLGEVALEHEGYVAAILLDGSRTSTWAREVAAVMTGKFCAACSCGWAGTREWDSDRGTEQYPAEGGKREEAILGEWEHHITDVVTEVERQEATAIIRCLRAEAAALEAAATDPAAMPAALAKARDAVTELADRLSDSAAVAQALGERGR
ncbi:hypothetical protein AB0I28_32550 [Phytomonospora sp. NPDC050363]|uniref:hypothetical protein n=1 Tax=Phytomonospora sp. NPDC050363 TaxID=3155642 RepID=UPI0033F23AE3